VIPRSLRKHLLLVCQQFVDLLGQILQTHQLLRHVTALVALRKYMALLAVGGV